MTESTARDYRSTLNLPKTGFAMTERRVVGGGGAHRAAERQEVD